MTPDTIIIRDDTLRQRVITLIYELNLLDGKAWEITIKRHRKKRTLSQLRLKWMWVDEVADHVAKYTGHTSDEINEWFKGQFLPEPPPIIVEGVSVPGKRSTKNLTTVEMSEFMTRIHAWATSELGMLLTLPEERHAA